MLSRRTLVGLLILLGPQFLGAQMLLQSVGSSYVMQADLDMNGYDILNVGNIFADNYIRLGNFSSGNKPTCDSSILGAMVFDTTNDKPYVCTSSGWQPEYLDSLSACNENTLTATSCSVGTSKYVTSINGGNLTGANGSLSISIPTGFYSGKTATAVDANLVASNILNGVSIFGVAGSVVAKYANCTDDILNVSSCSTATNRYVTATSGGNLTGANGSLSVTIPQGYYDGTKTTTVSDSNLVASNIKSGVTIFGVTGSTGGNVCYVSTSTCAGGYNTIQTYTSHNRYQVYGSLTSFNMYLCCTSSDPNNYTILWNASIGDMVTGTIIDNACLSGYTSIANGCLSGSYESRDGHYSASYACWRSCNK